MDKNTRSALSVLALISPQPTEAAGFLLEADDNDGATSMRTIWDITDFVTGQPLPDMSRRHCLIGYAYTDRYDMYYTCRLVEAMDIDPVVSRGNYFLPLSLLHPNYTSARASLLQGSTSARVLSNTAPVRVLGSFGMNAALCRAGCRMADLSYSHFVVFLLYDKILHVVPATSMSTPSKGAGVYAVRSRLLHIMHQFVDMNININVLTNKSLNVCLDDLQGYGVKFDPRVIIQVEGGLSVDNCLRRIEDNGKEDQAEQGSRTQSHDSAVFVLQQAKKPSCAPRFCRR